MNFQNLDAIAKSGFSGFISVSQLQTSKCFEVPKERGVYLLLRKTSEPPRFLAQSIGGHFKGKDPTVPLTELKAKWVDGTLAVYIGKAGSETGSATLRSRLWQYMQFGLGKPIGHWGGRYVWQLADSANLLVCWKPTGAIDPRGAESLLLQEFSKQYGSMPFANLVS